MAAPVLESSRGARGRSGRILLVRHLPAELEVSEKEDLLRHFGASSVRVLSARGRLKHTAFATFPSESAAAQALSRLHQLTLLGHTLVVEYAKEQENAPAPSQSSQSEKGEGLEEPLKEEKEKKEPKSLKIESGIAPGHGLTFPMDSRLRYRYPPPSQAILVNIANALASVPKFYVQVLHLMNKMNLPSPFGPMTARPPMCEDHIPLPPPPIPPYPPPEPPLPEEDDSQNSSKDGSEYESSDEEDKERFAKLMALSTIQPKRQLPAKPLRPRKKRKITDLLNVSLPTPHSLHPALSPSEVFEQPQNIGLKKIEFHISADIPTILQKSLENEQNNGINAAVGDETSNVGFGKTFPAPWYGHEEEEEEEEEEIPSEFISKRELERGRISEKEMKKLSVFKNYEAGNPNCRIYVKNLSKDVQEKDLKFIFGRYVDFSSETQRIMFHINLMKEGRMKGQAFVGFPHEKAAAKALKEANGYILREKPMVVKLGAADVNLSLFLEPKRLQSGQFARSARPKQDPNERKRKR